MKTLVVDDSHVTRRILMGILRQCGITDVEQAADGDDAVNKVLGQDFSLILLDWDMPRLCGIDALREIRAKGIKTFVVMITAERDRHRVIEALDAGANAYIVKPFSASVVKKRIGGVLDDLRHHEMRKRTRKALIADDSPTTRKLVAGTMRDNCGFQEWVEAADGDEALKALENGEFDIILLDWNMPNTSGIDALRQIRKKDKRTPVIMITGESDSHHIIEAFDAGATHYIVKPFQPELLTEKVSQAMRTSFQA